MTDIGCLTLELNLNTRIKIGETWISLAKSSVFKKAKIMIEAPKDILIRIERNGVFIDERKISTDELNIIDNMKKRIAEDI